MNFRFRNGNEKNNGERERVSAKVWFLLRPRPLFGNFFEKQRQGQYSGIHQVQFCEQLAEATGNQYLQKHLPESAGFLLEVPFTCCM